MKVVRQQSPGIHTDGAGLRQGGQAPDRVVPVTVVAKEPPPLNASRHDMRQDAWSI